MSTFQNCVFSGGYGFVFVAQDTSTGKEYALKVKINGSQLLFISYLCFLSVIDVKAVVILGGRGFHVTSLKC